MKKFTLKKVALLATTAVMLFSATGSVMAAYEEETLNVGSKGRVECYVYACSDYVEADTSTYANYDTIITASTDVELIIRYGEISYVENSDSYSESAVDTSAYSYSYVIRQATYYDKVDGQSTHSGTIDGVTVGCSLYAEN